MLRQYSHRTGGWREREGERIAGVTACCQSQGSEGRRGLLAGGKGRVSGRRSRAREGLGAQGRRWPSVAVSGCGEGGAAGGGGCSPGVCLLPWDVRSLCSGTFLDHLFAPLLSQWCVTHSAPQSPTCCGLNVSPRVQVEAGDPNCGSRKRRFRAAIELGGLCPRGGVVRSVAQALSPVRTVFCPLRGSSCSVSSWKQETRSSPDTEPGSTLSLDFLPPELGANKFLACK